MNAQDFAGRPWRVLVALALLLFHGFVFAQKQPSEQSRTGPEQDLLEKLEETPFLQYGPPPDSAGEHVASPSVPKVWCGDIDEPRTKATCWAAYRASLDYYSTGLEHRGKVIRWQHTSTVIIFFVVLVLVFAGLFFAWLQFKRDLKIPSDGSRQDHTVELSIKGIQVRSSVLGVIILTLSIAFFYLYLRYAYPIVNIF